MSNSSLWPIDKTLSGATTPGQSAPESDSNEGILCIPQNSSITEVSPSNYFSVISRTFVGGVLLLCRDAVGVSYSQSLQVWINLGVTETKV